MDKNDWLSSLDYEKSILNKSPITIIDVGSSASPPKKCTDIASISRYVGFDPDLREPQESTNFGFARYTIIDKAIVSALKNNVSFYLTKYPQCSSTLYPNIDECKHYSVSDFFEVVDQVQVPATNLNVVIQQLELSSIDWLKLDTQGTDYDILVSLDLAFYNKLLVVDLEPGATCFYINENRFSDIHEFMLNNGFWLADLVQQRFPRISNKTSKKLKLSSEDMRNLGDNPFAFELQYFRSIDFLAEQGIELRDFVSFWILAMTNCHYSFAIEIGMSADKFGIKHDLGKKLALITLSYCQQKNQKKNISKTRKVATLLIPPIFDKIFSKIK
jgi:hypothetical protein